MAWSITSGGDAIGFPYVRTDLNKHCSEVALTHDGITTFTAEEIRDRGSCLDAANALLGAGTYTSEITITSATEADWNGCYGCLFVDDSTTVRFCDYDAATNNADAMPDGLQKLCAISVLPSPPQPSHSSRTLPSQSQSPSGMSEQPHS